MKFLFFLLFAIPVLGWSQSHQDLTDLCSIENSEIIILGTSNVTDYTCKLYDFSNNSNIEISSEVFGHTIKLQNAKVQLQAKGFDCENRIMTNDFFKAIKGEQHPIISVEFHQFTLTEDVAQHPVQQNIPSKISIRLAGVRNFYSPRLSSLKVKSDQLTFTGFVDLKMTDFDIVPPTALFGTVKTADEIRVEFQITFQMK